MARKESGEKEPDHPFYEDIHLPKNSSVGVLIGIFSLFLGLAMVFYIFWLAALCLIGILSSIITRLYQKETEFTVTAKEVEEIEKRRLPA